MKLLSLIFALYFFALGLMPCADSIECDHIEKQEVTKASNHSDHEHSTEMCSPFCVCACCSIQLVFTAKINFILAPKLYHNGEDFKNFFYVSHISNNYLSQIWQPPRFVNV
jgi:hypothetical protein